MNNLVKKVTPKGDLSWYVKWVGTLLIIIGLIFRANMYLTPFDLMLSAIGCMLWAYVGYLWHDRALIILNTASSTILFYAIIRWYGI